MPEKNKYANHTLYIEQDPDAPNGVSIGFACIYSYCYGLDCIGVEAALGIDEDYKNNPDNYHEGDVYIGAYGDRYEYDIYWQYAERDPDFDEAKESRSWADAHSAATTSYITFNQRAV